MTSRRFRVMRRASWRPFQNLRSRTALRCGSTGGSVCFNQMGTTSKDATVRMMENSTNAEIWTQVGYFSDTPRIIYLARVFGIEFGQNWLKCSNFLRFWIFWELSKNCLTQANFELSSRNFVRKCTNIEWCLILNFLRRSRPSNLRRIWFYFLSWHQIFLIRAPTKLPPWGSQNQGTYFLKERTLWIQWESNMGIPIHILFELSKE